MNEFGNLRDIHNEADVEQVFARRFIEALGYSDAEIRPKHSLTELTVRGLHNQPEAPYRPDFAVKVGRDIRWILEAKSPSENLERHVGQPRAYCTILNGEFLNSNPVQYFVLTNGRSTRLYQWDYNVPLLELRFEDFIEDNQRYGELKSILDRDAFMSAIRTEPLTLRTSHHLVKAPIEEVNAAFSSCHQHIYRSDNISQAAAFTEFVKIIALKLMADRQIKENYPSVLAEESIDIPAQEVQFSTAWIADQRDDNPLDTDFRRFIRDMERDIVSGDQKRIFEEDEQIALRPETIKGVVERLEHLFLVVF